MTNDILTPDEVDAIEDGTKRVIACNCIYDIHRLGTSHRVQAARIKRLEQENDEQRWQLRTVQVRNTVGGNE